MSLKSKLVGTVGTALALAIGAGMLFESPPGKPYRPGNNSKRPSVVTFVVSYIPQARRGGPPGVAISWHAGVLEGTPLAVHSPWTMTVAAPPPFGVLLLSATPARNHEHRDVTQHLACSIFIGGLDGRRLGLDEPTHPENGCLVQKVMPPR